MIRFPFFYAVSVEEAIRGKHFGNFFNLTCMPDALRFEAAEFATLGTIGFEIKARCWIFVTKSEKKWIETWAQILLYLSFEQMRQTIEKILSVTFKWFASAAVDFSWLLKIFTEICYLRVPFYRYSSLNSKHIGLK